MSTQCYLSRVRPAECVDAGPVGALRYPEQPGTPGPAPHAVLQKGAAAAFGRILPARQCRYLRSLRGWTGQ